MQVKSILVAICLILIGNSTALPQIATIPAGTIEVLKGKRIYVGKALAADAQTLVLLQQDGRLKLLPKDESSFGKQVSTKFTPFSTETIRQKLLDEFGSNYRVSITSHYVVVHPPGSHHLWAQPFEELYSRFEQYFMVRGIAVATPQFPLVAVVLNTRQEFDLFLERYQQELASPNVVGYYSPLSNRMITYNQASGGPSSKVSIFTQDTIVHEATHQAAFNTQIHSRFTPTPRWFSEGLATMFEARGVNNSPAFPNFADRINRSQLNALLKFMEPGVSQGVIVSLVQDDELFRADPQRAYAYSWGLAFFLAETRPLEFAAFINKTSSRTSFGSYSANQRIEDFIRTIGMDLDDLEIRLSRFVQKMN